MRRLLPLLLLSSAAAGCGLFQSELVTEQIPALVDALHEDADARVTTTEKVGEVADKLGVVLDWLDYILAGCAAGVIALVSTWGKTAARKWAERKKPARRRAK